MRRSLLLLALVILLAACDADPLLVNDVSAPTASLAHAAPPRPTPTPTIAPVTVPTRAPGGDPLSPTVIFQKVSPSVAFVETGTSTGSGVLIEGGYLLTNAHVVWPFDRVRVVFPDGTEISEAPVFDWDLMADLALIGPLAVTQQPLPLVDGEDLIVGTDVYLIGYPGEVESFPQPTISRGLISRLRQWEARGITYFQSDAKIAGGQSGGVLVSDRGEVVGISGFSFANNEFALVASAADLAPLVERMRTQQASNALIASQMRTDEGSRRHVLTLQGDWADEILIAREDVGTDVTIDVHMTGAAEVFAEVLDPYGDYVDYSYFSEGDEDRFEFSIAYNAPYFVRFTQWGGDRPSNTPDGEPFTVFAVTSNVDLIPFQEGEEPANGVALGDRVTGILDFPGDVDVFYLPLGAGEEATLRLESALIDPLLRVDIVGVAMHRWDLPSDDDSGGGIFGLDAELTYRAPQDGLYAIVVEDAIGYAQGGYVLTIEEPDDRAPTPIVPLSTPTPIVSAFGEMDRYTSDSAIPFQIQYPVDWLRTSRSTDFSAICQTVTDCFYRPNGGVVLAILEEDLAAQGIFGIDQEEYVDLVLERLRTETPQFELLSRESYANERGEKVTEVAYSLQNNLLHARRLIALADGTGFNAIFLYPGRTAAAVFPDLDQAGIKKLNALIDYVFSTFEIGAEG